MLFVAIQSKSCFSKSKEFFKRSSLGGTSFHMPTSQRLATSQRFAFAFGTGSESDGSSTSSACRGKMQGTWRCSCKNSSTQYWWLQLPRQQKHQQLHRAWTWPGCTRTTQCSEKSSAYFFNLNLHSALGSSVRSSTPSAARRRMTSCSSVACRYERNFVPKLAGSTFGFF